MSDAEFKQRIAEQLKSAIDLDAAGWPQGTSRDVILLTGLVMPRTQHDSSYRGIDCHDLPSHVECIKYARRQWPCCSFAAEISQEYRDGYRVELDTNPFERAAPWYVAEHQDDPDQAARVVLAEALSKKEANDAN